MTPGGLDDLARSYSITAGATGPAVTPGGLAIGVSHAKKLKAKPGDEVRLVAPIISPDGSLSTKSGQFVIGAIFDSGMNFIDTNMCLMNLANAQDFFCRVGKVDGVYIHLANLHQTGDSTDATRTPFPDP